MTDVKVKSNKEIVFKLPLFCFSNLPSNWIFLLEESFASGIIFEMQNAAFLKAYYLLELS